MSSKDPERGQRRVRVSPELIEHFMLETSLPDDARLLEICRSNKAIETGTYTFVFESKEWDEMEEGEHIPLITLIIEE